jgi:hypothetical protein
MEDADGMGTERKAKNRGSLFRLSVVFTADGRADFSATFRGPDGSVWRMGHRGTYRLEGATLKEIVTESTILGDPPLALDEPEHSDTHIRLTANRLILDDASHDPSQRTVLTRVGR